MGFWYRRGVTDATMQDKHEKPAHEDERTPFERFKDLARRIIAVPKEEVDRKKAE
jgi:hypothetical protein